MKAFIYILYIYIYIYITLGNSNIQIEIVHCTSPSLSQLLSNNGNVHRNSHIRSSDGYAACRHHMVNHTGVVCNSVTGKRLKVDNNLNCSDGGIYVIDTTCTAKIQEKRSIMVYVQMNISYTVGQPTGVLTDVFS